MSVTCRLRPDPVNSQLAADLPLNATTLLVAFCWISLPLRDTGISSHSLLLLDSIQAMSGQDMRKSPF